MLLPVLGFLLCYPVICGVTAKWHLLLLWQCFSFVHGGLSPNAMINPIYTLMCGGITGLLNQTRTSKARGIRLSTAERYLVQQRQHYNLLAPVNLIGRKASQVNTDKRHYIQNGENAVAMRA